jgi:hypothetical protein
VGSPVGGFHDAAAAAGDDDGAPPRTLPTLRNEAGEAPGFRAVLSPLGGPARVGALGQALARRRPRASENDDRGFDPLLLQRQLGFEQLELQAHWAQLVAQQQIQIVEGQPVARRECLRCLRLAPRRSFVCAGGREDAPALVLAHRRGSSIRCGSGGTNVVARHPGCKPPRVEAVAPRPGTSAPRCAAGSRAPRGGLLRSPTVAGRGERVEWVEPGLA